MVMLITNRQATEDATRALLANIASCQIASHEQASQNKMEDIILPALQLILVDFSAGQACFPNEGLKAICHGDIFPGVPILALIDHLDQRSQVAALGLTDYLLLPCDPALDAARIRNLLRLHQECTNLRNDLQAAITQDAFIGLIARIITEELSAESIAMRTVEQMLQFLHAASGVVWLLQPDQRTLHLAVSLTSSFDFNPTPDIPLGQGLIGWAAAHRQSVCIMGSEAIHDARFDLVLDNCLTKKDKSFLIVPLHHHRQIIGVMAICASSKILFSEREISLSESIADLAAATMVNARLVTALRENIAQQHALYEMSQQVAEKLDLQTTLDRALQWFNRLCETEFGILWASETNDDWLHPLAHLGISLDRVQWSGCERTCAPFSETFRTGRTTIYNHLDTQGDFAQKISQHLQVRAENMIVIPMRAHGEITGFFTLINKVGAGFTPEDATLLATAGEMIGIAVGNAQTHARLLALIAERDALARQVIHTERLATVGRLTASLSHEINNPMQAIRGALTLALEDIHDTEEVITFLQMSLNETDRVVDLVSRMRQIYRPQQDEPEILHVNEVLQETIRMASKELHRQDVTLDVHLTDEPTLLRSIRNQLHLIFLSLLLNFADSLGQLEGGSLGINSEMIENAITVTFTTTNRILSETSWLRTFQTGIPYKETNTSFSSSISHDILIAHQAQVEICYAEGEVIALVIRFPRYHTAP
jgi:GAF domain-containing protein